MPALSFSRADLLSSLALLLVLAMLSPLGYRVQTVSKVCSRMMPEASGKEIPFLQSLQGS
jgi:hypothetical protein